MSKPKRAPFLESRPSNIGSIVVSYICQEGFRRLQKEDKNLRQSTITGLSTNIVKDVIKPRPMRECE